MLHDFVVSKLYPKYRADAELPEARKLPFQGNDWWPWIIFYLLLIAQITWIIIAFVRYKPSVPFLFFKISLSWFLLALVILLALNKGILSRKAYIRLLFSAICAGFCSMPLSFLPKLSESIISNFDTIRRPKDKTSAVVYSIYETNVKWSSGRVDYTCYESYSFKIKKDTTTYFGKVDESGSCNSNNIKEGDSIDVVYLKSNPSINYKKGTMQNAPAFYLFINFGIILILFWSCTKILKRSYGALTTRADVDPQKN